MFSALLSPVFVRIYASIVLAFALFVVAAYAYWDYEESATDISDFVADTQVIATPLMAFWQQQP